MVASILKTAVVTVLALGNFVVNAAPAPVNARSEEIFSIEKWITDKIENPTGQHLSASEAFVAWNQSMSALHSTEFGTTVKRQSNPVCNHQIQYGYSAAWAPDAVTCIDYLAGLGGTACRIGPERTTSSFVARGFAEIVGVNGQSNVAVQQTTCQNIAQTAGRIMDVCWQPSNTVQGTMLATNNRWIAVHISAPGGL
ncbi:hypothetical protein QBC35DRAFT_443365 [Podospora australis]|uniref:Ecp2 effector protein domain-containing protein n=1 Tax=Podospora australis TaxID=1536484 RepID=A0AAN7AF01_9PEZI|nr:hypothetical protein QBC35DRAFT_443365 [Podospora australis]